MRAPQPLKELVNLRIVIRRNKYVIPNLIIPYDESQAPRLTHLPGVTHDGAELLCDQWDIVQEFVATIR